LRKSRNAAFDASLAAKLGPAVDRAEVVVVPGAEDGAGGAQLLEPASAASWAYFARRISGLGLSP